MLSSDEFLPHFQRTVYFLGLKILSVLVISFSFEMKEKLFVLTEESNAMAPKEIEHHSKSRNTSHTLPENHLGKQVLVHRCVQHLPIRMLVNEAYPCILQPIANVSAELVKK